MSLLDVLNGVASVLCIVGFGLKDLTKSVSDEGVLTQFNTPFPCRKVDSADFSMLALCGSAVVEQENEELLRVV